MDKLIAKILSIFPESIQKLYYDHEEVWQYIFWGGMNTLLNLILYAICTRVFGMTPVVANAYTWVLGTLFAFFTNKIFVFRSQEKDVKKVLQELIKFASGRIGTFFVGEAITYVGCNLLHINDFVVWFVNSAFVALLNYFVGKILAFKK